MTYINNLRRIRITKTRVVTMISKMNFERFIETYSDSNDDSRIGCVGSIISTSLENAELDEDITKDKKSSTQSGVSILETG